jgi:hypothetical protein
MPSRLQCVYRRHRQPKEREGWRDKQCFEEVKETITMSALILVILVTPVNALAQTGLGCCNYSSNTIIIDAIHERI